MIQRLKLIVMTRFQVFRSNFENAWLRRYTSVVPADRAAAEIAALEGLKRSWMCDLFCVAFPASKRFGLSWADFVRWVGRVLTKFGDAAWMYVLF